MSVRNKSSPELRRVFDELGWSKIRLEKGTTPIYKHLEGEE